MKFSCICCDYNTVLRSNYERHLGTFKHHKNKKNYVKIQNNVSVYEGVELEDYIFCGPSMVFTNVLNPRCKYPL